MNQIISNPLIRYQDLLIVARDHKLNDDIKAYWSKFGLGFFKSEADRIIREIKEAGGLKDVKVFHELYTPLCCLSDFLQENILYLETRNGISLLNKPINEQSIYWKKDVYEFILEKYFKISY